MILGGEYIKNARLVQPKGVIMPNADMQRAAMIASYMADEPVVEKWMALRPRIYAALRPGDFDPILYLIDSHLKLWTEAVEIEFGLREDWSVERRAEIHGPVDVAFAKLLETAPTTMVGLRAVVEYLVAWDDSNVLQAGGAYLQTLLRSPILQNPLSASAARAA
jgi:hypothetical protein